FSIKTIKYQLYNCSPDFEIEFKSANQFIITASKINKTIHISKLIKNKTQILNENLNENMKYAIMLSINNRLFIINKENDNKVTIHHDKRAELLFHETNFSVQRKGKSFLIKGSIDYKFNIPVDTLLTGKGEFLGQLNWNNNRQFEALIEKKSLEKLIDIHNSIWFAMGDKFVHSMYSYNLKKTDNIVEDSFINRRRAYIIRLNKNYSYTLSIIPALPIYNNFNKMKINLAELISKKFPNLFNKKRINLYFEKEASKASESGSEVFKEVM